MAQIIDAAASRGMPPGSYDEAELWELAAALGANRVDDDEESPRQVTADPLEFQAKQ